MSSRVLGLPTHTKKVGGLENLILKTIVELGRIHILVDDAASNPAMGHVGATEESAFDQIDTNL